MSGLLRYRYQKREEEKLPSRKSLGDSLQRAAPVVYDSASQMTQSSSSFNSQTKCSTNNLCQTSPSRAWVQRTTTDTAQKSCNISPNQSKCNANVTNGQVESGESQESPVFNGVKRIISVAPPKMSQQQSSPQWKTKPSMANQCRSPCPTGEQSPVCRQAEKSNHSLTSPDRELLVHISGLAAMFPFKKRDEIERVLKAAGNNFEKAVDYMIDNKIPPIVCRTEKRKSESVASSVSSPASSPIQPPIKRARKLSVYDSDSEVEQTTTPEKTASQIMAGKIQFLQQAFPLLPRQLLVTTLNQQGDVDQACAVLENMCSKSQTENVGSIKAMKQAIVIAIATGKSPPVSTSVVMTHKNTDTDKSKSHFKPEVNNQNDVGSDEEWQGAEVSSDEEQVDIYEGGEGMILKFINEAALCDLLHVDGCSKKKAQCIVELRPFQSWEHMANRFEETKLLSFRLLAGCKELLRIRNVVQKLMLKCERISKDIEAVVSEFTEKLSLEQTTISDCVSQQPAILNPEMKLTPYQLVGLNWLVVMHDQELNGILGDEMGLGKTIQTIAYLAYMKEHGEEGPHLVIAPSSTLDNWLRELKLWCPSLRVMMYYGSQEERTHIRQQLLMGTHEDFDVAVTTYNMATGSVQDRALFKKFSWHYAIFDEGHMLKNMSSMRYRTLARIKARRRLLLTGTPLQNNLVELMSLLAFVMPDMFTDKTDPLKKIFNSMTGRSSDEKRSTYELENIAHAKHILRPFFLRRLKSEVLQQLPKKTEYVKRVPLAYEQRELYDKLRQQFSKSINENGLKGHGPAMMMQLRKAANHHLLHREQYDIVKLRHMAKDMLKEPTHYESIEKYVLEDMEVMSDFELYGLCKQYKSLKKYMIDDALIMDSGKFRFLDSLMPDLKQKDSRVLLFSQFTMMMDIMEVYLKKRDYLFIRLDGSTPVAERQELIDRFNADSSIFVFLLSTKAGGLGINLTAADTVVLHDMDFNPYNDKQAEDRCHRLGQKRNVTVYKLLSTNTIEEGILKCAQEKLKLEQDVTGSKKGDQEPTDDVISLLKTALDIDS